MRLAGKTFRVPANHRKPLLCIAARLRIAIQSRLYQIKAGKANKTASFSRKPAMAESSHVISPNNGFKFVEGVDLNDIPVPTFPDFNLVVAFQLHHGNLFPVVRFPAGEMLNVLDVLAQLVHSDLFTSAQRKYLLQSVLLSGSTAPADTRNSPHGGSSPGSPASVAAVSVLSAPVFPLRRCRDRR